MLTANEIDRGVKEYQGTDGRPYKVQPGNEQGWHAVKAFIPERMAWEYLGEIRLAEPKLDGVLVQYTPYEVSAGEEADFRVGSRGVALTELRRRAMPYLAAQAA